MCKVYYPFFQIERISRKKYNHKLSLFTLALFCDKILIPVRHLLEMDNDSFDILFDNKCLFQEGIIYSRIPATSKSLSEYCNGIKTEITGKTENAKNIRISKVLVLYGDNKLDVYDPSEQQDYYTEKIAAFVNEYIAKHRRNFKGYNEIQQICSMSPNKETFDLRLKDLRNSDTITSKIFDRMMAASNIIYFFAGASAQQLSVCYDGYLFTNPIKDELEVSIAGFNNIINKHYNPAEITLFLKKLKVIDDKNDLENLTIEDVLYLRKQSCFKKFVKKFDQYSTKATFDDFFDKERSVFLFICKLKSALVSIFLSVILTSIFGILLPSTLVSILIEAACSLILTYVLTYLFQTKCRYNIPLIEICLDKIIENFDPVSLYLAKLRWRIKSNHLSPS